MARTNKYASINYNYIYERNVTSNSANNPTKHPSSNSGSYSSVSPNAYKNHFYSSSSPSGAHGHGRMLVLTRPATKPVSSISNPPQSSSPQIPLTQQSQPQIHTSDQPRSEPESDQISLRPLGRTGAANCVSPSALLPQKEVVVSQKPNKFVPPHLRPGFVGKEEGPVPELFRGKEANHRPSLLQQQQHQGYLMSPGGYKEDGRPKSGGHDRMRRGGVSDPGLMNRPRSSGNRP